MRSLVVLAALVSPARAQWAVGAYVDNDVAGHVQSGRLGLGVSAGYYLRDGLGLELDAELHGHFFRDQDVAYLMPANVDLNTSAALGSANVVLPHCLRGAAGTWCPYATAGAGVIRARFEGLAHAADATGFDRADLDVAVNAGIGVTHALTRWVGLRVDARYFRAFASDGATYAHDFGDWRVSVGVAFGGPR